MEDVISMSYGNGGKKTSDLIEKIILPKLKNSKLDLLLDGALLNVKGEIAFSTDSFVIYPYFFPGGDIGKLAVCGTVNDLLMCGSIPKYLSLSLIIEEGFSINHLEKIVESIADVAKSIGVLVVTGDTKVVDKGHGHGIYINTSGIGEKIEGITLGKHRIEVGDKVILSGNCGDHGISILCARENLIEEEILSDCTPLNKVVYSILNYKENIKILRDPTRGGVATTLNEFVEGEDFSVEIIEELVPVDEKVKTISDLLGIDPLYSANEGKVLAIVSRDVAEDVVKDLNKINDSKEAKIIGEVVNNTRGKVLLKGPLGGTRILEKLQFDMLPRIC